MHEETLIINVLKKKKAKSFLDEKAMILLNIIFNHMILLNIIFNQNIEKYQRYLFAK